MNSPAVSGISAEADCQQALARLEMAIRASGDVLYEWDLASDRLAFFGDVSTLFTGGPLPVPATGEALQARINPEDVPRRRRALSDHFADRKSTSLNSSH